MFTSEKGRVWLVVSCWREKRTQLLTVPGRARAAAAGGAAQAR